jgi:hypothetical protein
VCAVHAVAAAVVVTGAVAAPDRVLVLVIGDAAVGSLAVVVGRVLVLVVDTK